jgi:outer membrane biosynthesis protein TonB
MVPIAETFPAQSSTSYNFSRGMGGRLSVLFHRQPALKYVIAVCVLVALVILLVVVGLRGDGSKQPQPANLPANNPAATVETPKPAGVESPNSNPETERKPVEGMNVAGKHGSAKPLHRGDVSPAPTQKRTGKTDPVLQARPNPFDDAKTVSQGQISAVVRSKANQAALKICYERALKMDNRLTSGRVDVTVSIGTSGAVQRVVINAPSSFILVEPCIKNAVRRWVFPPNSEEYATNFPLIMQGGY